VYPNTQLFIDGAWCNGGDGKSSPVLNPASAEAIGRVAHAAVDDLDRALAAADRAFKVWKRVPVFDRYRVMRRAAALLRERAADIGRIMTLEQGKPVAEATGEVERGADAIEWFAEEARHAFGRIVPSRAPEVYQLVTPEPVGPVAAFTPWNFPVNQAVRKISVALATGCTVILKGPEETPASCAALVQAFADAGLPDGALNLVFGVPADISRYLIAHPVIRKISFTGSTAVGKQLAALAGQHMKRVTMELGGHSPVLVFDDADLDAAVDILAQGKFRNAGQVCTSPTRFLVQDGVYEEFVERFVARAKSIKVGDGMEAGTQMGPLANIRRQDAMSAMVADAVSKQARVLTGGARPDRPGFFFEPTILADVPLDSAIMNDEPFGPVVPVRSFHTRDEALAEANRLSYGLAGYVYTRSAANAARVSAELDTGMICVNHHGLGLVELPFGGVKDSGYGSEGGTEAMENYVNHKMVSMLNI
jgi:succinate-semialdehyde dehydrogenase / glutarate-semialdehyde dehydrogenase